jgi:hypothetical protein
MKGIYWSSGSYAGNTFNAWFFQMNDGCDKTGVISVWPVRGGL